MQRLPVSMTIGLREAAEALRGPLLRHRFRRDLVARAFAIVREVSTRRLGMRHYPVQLMGGIALIEGRLVEMETGEGKTLTASLAAATAVLAGIPTHVLTVNDYLAARDAEQLRPVYEALGLSVGVVQHGQTAAERRAAYGCDITYGANKEIAFDYLRDRLALGQRTRGNLLVDRLSRKDGAPAMLLRGLHFAIVDEADSILVDEARTPLIIAGASGGEDNSAVYATALRFTDGLVVGRDYSVAPDGRTIAITEAGCARSSPRRRAIFLEFGRRDAGASNWRRKRSPRAISIIATNSMLSSRTKFRSSMSSPAVSPMAAPGSTGCISLSR